MTLPCRVEMALNRQEIKGKPLFITGHSLGGAVAAIATRRLNAEYRRSPRVTPTDRHESGQKNGWLR